MKFPSFCIQFHNNVNIIFNRSIGILELAQVTVTERYNFLLIDVLLNDTTI